MKTEYYHGSLVSSKRILYTPSSFARENLIHLQEVGELKALKSHKSIRKNLHSYLFFIVIRGEGTLQYNNIETKLIQNDCVFIDCRHEYFQQSSDKKLWELQWIHFDGPNMNAIYNKYKERGGSSVFHAKKHDYISVLKEIYDIAEQESYVKDMKICEKITELLTCLLDEAWKDSIISSKKDVIQEVKNYLNKNYSSHITLDLLSSKFYINKFYLSKSFARKYGITINNYLNQIRITQAKYYLRFTDLTIAQISHKVGIYNSNYFTRLFFKTEKMTPSYYRKAW